ncbi:DUF3519 domain-containing protein, partial [Helicobacter pylori]|uniref:DUF3519 domain-containing protein n=1 Tax=Helicobacter pylori TaxID=210 RepID=UPI0029294F0C
AGAFYKEGLGDIDLVWGNKDYGLEHILKRRIESYIKKGLEPKFAEQRALNLVRMIPEAIEKGKVGRDSQGRLKIETKDILVALRDNWQDEPLKSKWVITGFEKKVGNLREQAKFIDPSLITKDGEHLASSLNSVESNHTTNALKSQTPLSEQANAKKLAKLESEKGIKEASKKSAEETKKGIKRDYSDKKLNNDEIKELLNNAEIPTSGRDAVIFGKNNLTPEIVEFMHKNNKKMIIEKASNKELELLKDANFRHPEDVRASLDHESITHILKRHGVNSVNVRNGESPITYEDIANYRNIVNNADEIIRAIGKGNKENITAFKQINGYAVVVEQAVNRNSELVLKTMFKSNGDYKNNNAYKKFSSTGLNANAKVQP